LNTDITGRHQQRWWGPETRSHRTAVVVAGKREEGRESALHTFYTLHKDR
jgi:hypothetical protein